jgi:hypothetical protein
MNSKVMYNINVWKDGQRHTLGETETPSAWMEMYGRLVEHLGFNYEVIWVESGFPKMVITDPLHQRTFNTLFVEHKRTE